MEKYNPFDGDNIMDNNGLNQSLFVMKCPNKLCLHEWIPRVPEPLRCPRCKRFLKKKKSLWDMEI